MAGVECAERQVDAGARLVCKATVGTHFHSYSRVGVVFYHGIRLGESIRDLGLDIDLDGHLRPATIHLPSIFRVCQTCGLDVDSLGCEAEVDDVWEEVSQNLTSNEIFDDVYVYFVVFRPLQLPLPSSF